MAEGQFVGVLTQDGAYVRKSTLDVFKREESRQLRDPVTMATYGRMGLVKPLYNLEVLARLLEMNTYHYRACRTKGRDTAGLGYRFESTVDGDPSDPINHDLERKSLQEFFDSQSPPITETFTRAQFDYEGIGWGCVEMTRVGGIHDALPDGLYHVPSHTLRIHVDGDRFAQIRMGKYRWFKAVGARFDIHKDTGKVHAIGSLPPNQAGSELIVWTNYHPRSDYYGLPDIVPALGALMGDLSRRDYNLAFFNNYGVPSYAVYVTGDFDPGQRDVDSEGKPTGPTPMERDIASHFSQLRGNPYSTLVMTIPKANGTGGEVKVHFEKLAVDVSEASFRLYRSDNRDEILAAHGVPPYRMGMAFEGALGGTTAKEATEIYKRSVIEPRQDLIEDLINLHILRNGFKINGWRFAFDELDNQDELQEMTLWESVWKMGAATNRDVRRAWAQRFGLDPEGEINEDMVPGDDALLRAIEAQMGASSGGPSLLDVIQQRRQQRIAEAYDGGGNA